MYHGSIPFFIIFILDVAIICSTINAEDKNVRKDFVCIARSSDGSYKKENKWS